MRSVVLCESFFSYHKPHYPDVSWKPLQGHNYCLNVTFKARSGNLEPKSKVPERNFRVLWISQFQLLRWVHIWGEKCSQYGGYILGRSSCLQFSVSIWGYCLCRNRMECLQFSSFPVWSCQAAPFVAKIHHSVLSLGWTEATSTPFGEAFSTGESPTSNFYWLVLVSRKYLKWVRGSTLYKYGYGFEKGH